MQVMQQWNKKNSPCNELKGIVQMTKGVYSMKNLIQQRWRLMHQYICKVDLII